MEVVSVPNRYPCCGGIVRFAASEVDKARVTRRCPSCETPYEVARRKGNVIINPDTPRARRLDRITFIELEEGA